MSVLSVIIPVFNEKNTILELIDRVHQVNLSDGFSKEIIVVDDGSTDGTSDLLSSLSSIKLISHERNLGKGAALITGIKQSNGDYIIVQDADLEYDPQDFNVLLSRITVGDVKVVYGSRQLKKQKQRHSGLSFYFGGLFLTWLTNILYGQSITDEPTCYKMFEAKLLKSLPLTCKRFEFCPEVTALLFNRKIKIVEVPINYYPRDKMHGKKIGYRDGLEAIWTLIKYKFK